MVNSLHTNNSWKSKRFGIFVMVFVASFQMYFLYGMLGNSDIVPKYRDFDAPYLISDLRVKSASQSDLEVSSNPLHTARQRLEEFMGQLPTWMTDYFAWHNDTRSQLSESNWNQTQYLVLHCSTSKSCGGFSDRIKPLPYIVLYAAIYKRLIFIDWERPAKLEDFLLPPSGGVDWRLPSWLKPLLDRANDERKHLVSCDDLALQLQRNSSVTVYRTKVQTPDACEVSYVSHPNVSESSYAGTYHGLFRVFFEPVNRILTKIDDLMTQRALVPGKYSAAHLRNLYGNRLWRHPNETISLVMNGINCASTKLPGGPVYFASDDNFAVKAALAYGQQNALPVASLDIQHEPLHLDKDDAWRTRDPSAYDDTFIDMYLLGQARCVAFSNGGYGTFGMLLSYNASCGIRFFKGRKLDAECNWTDVNLKENVLTPPSMNIPQEMFIPPSNKK